MFEFLVTQLVGSEAERRAQVSALELAFEPMVVSRRVYRKRSPLTFVTDCE